MPSIVEGARSWLSAWQPVEMPPEKEAAFERYIRDRFERHGVVLALLCSLAALLWWPADYLIYRDLPQYIAPTHKWRTVAIVVGAAYFPLVRLPPFRTRPGGLLIGSGLVVSAAIGWATGLIGGLDRPEPHLLYLLLIGTIPMPLAPRARVLVTLAFAGAILGGYLIPFPAYLSSPYLPVGVSMMTLAMVVSVTFGHMLYLLLRSNFFQTALLADNNALLEERVADRTRELCDLLSRLETTREEERNRIAREIHDELGQELTAQRLTLAIAEDCLDGEPDTARAKLVEMRALLDRTMATVRTLIADLRPWVLHDLGLAEAARWLARRTEELSGTACELEVSGDLASLDRERSAAVFRILQESLNNVTKHAQATIVQIEIETTDEDLVLHVRDDGIGPGERTGRRGFGVVGMRERAHALGGEFELRGRAGGGTEVTCRLPLAGEVDGAR
jgi:signal transduction histidine kinase